MSNDVVWSSWVCDYGDERPTQGVGVWLCEQCVSEVSAMLLRLEHSDLWRGLSLIQSGIERAFTLPGRKSKGKPGSQSPANLSALVVIQDLSRFESVSLQQWRSLGRLPSGTEGVRVGKAKQQFEDALQLAEAMVHGEDEDRPTSDYIAYKLAQVPAMTPAAAEKYFKEHIAPMKLTANQCYNWAKPERGRLIAVPGTKPARYRAIDIFKAWENRHMPNFVPEVPPKPKHKVKAGAR